MRVVTPAWHFVSGLAFNLKQGLLEGLGRIRIYDKPLWFVFNPTGYQIHARQIREALAVLKPGDVVVRKYNTYLSSYFIPGRFSHSGVYVGEQEADGMRIGCVVHALGTGVQMQDVIDFFMTCDEFAILRPQAKEADGSGTSGVAIAERACAIARSYIGTPYDYTFTVAGDYANKDEVEKHTKSVYCHELTRSCYPDLDVPLIEPVLWNGMIRSSTRQFLAESFFRSPDFKVVYDSFFSHVHA